MGIVERGEWTIKDAVTALPWLPDGPIPIEVHWRLDGYERVSYGALAPRVAADVPERASATPTPVAAEAAA